MSANSVLIKPAIESDFNEIWSIIHAVLQDGRTYPHPAETTKEEAHEMWMNRHVHPYVAISKNQIVGTYILKPNWPGAGSHVGNASYMVSPACAGQGVGKAMAEHSLKEAQAFGFSAMQFNFVVSSNIPAVNLWKKFGFEIVGTLPQTFKHPDLGLVDAYVMYRCLP